MDRARDGNGMEEGKEKKGEGEGMGFRGLAALALDELSWRLLESS